MERTYYLALSCLIIFKSYGHQSLHEYTKPQVITTPDFPKPYPSYSNSTWKWSKDSGIWAVLLETLDIDCRDLVYVKDIQSNKRNPVGCSSSTEVPIYIHGPLLEIRFSTSDNHDKFSGFKIQILSGRDLDDVKVQVYDKTQKERETEEKKTSHVSILLIILVATVIIITCCLFVLFIFKRRGRNQSQDDRPNVSVFVNNVRLGTGVSYKKSASTSESIASEESVTTNVKIERQRVTRTPSQRSWTTRAALATKSNVAVDNLYSHMGNYENQINRPLSALVEYDPLSKPVPNANVHPTTISGYEAPVVPKY